MNFEQYLTFLKELQKELDDLTAVQQQKIAAIQGADLDILNECMKQEQATTLSLRGLERKRDSMLSALGLSGVLLRDLPRRCPAAYQAQTTSVVESLQHSYQVLSSAQTAARTLMETQLHLIKKELTKQGIDLEITEHYQTNQFSAPQKMRTDFRA